MDGRLLVPPRSLRKLCLHPVEVASRNRGVCPPLCDAPCPQGGYGGPPPEGHPKKEVVLFRLPLDRPIPELA
jgi:hypothetical protein